MKITIARLLSVVPSNAFSATLGLSGLALVWRQTTLLGWSTSWVGDLLFVISGFVFLILIALKAAELVIAPGEIRSNWSDANGISSFGLLTMSVIVNAQLVAPISSLLSLVLLVIGVIGGLLVAGRAWQIWLSGETLPNATPSWFIPAVGTIIACPLLLEMGYSIWAMLLLLTGLVGWIILLPHAIKRLKSVLADPAKAPTATILIAPPALVCSAIVASHIPYREEASLLLAGISCLFLIFLMTKLVDLSRTVFSAAVWSFTFPLHALCLATISCHQPGSTYFYILNLTFVASTTAITMLVASRSVYWIINRK